MVRRALQRCPHHPKLRPSIEVVEEVQQGPSPKVNTKKSYNIPEGITFSFDLYFKETHMNWVIYQVAPETLRRQQSTP
jgi:hypothetical protein